MTETVIVSKLAGKTMDIDASAGKKERTFLYRVFGKANGVKVSESPRDGAILYGVTGDFRAIAAHSPDKVYQSGVLYLPPGVNEMVVGAVDTGAVDDKGRQVFTEIKFAFDVYSKPATSPAGYQYEVLPIVDAKETDVMLELQSELPPFPVTGKALASEVKTEKKTR
jgi:hypothetical protein